MAKKDYEVLIQKFPKWSLGVFSYAGFLQSNGNRRLAKRYLKAVLNLEPNHAGSYLALAGLQDMSKNLLLVEDMKISLKYILKLSDAHNDEKMKLYYALGKSMSDLKKYDEAFNCWNNANKIQLQKCPFTVKDMLPFYQSLKECFSRVEFTKQRIKKYSFVPIFIIGLPRSGSTLLEQMLASHSEIETIGESSCLSNDVVNALQQITKTSYPRGVESITEEQLV